MATIVDKTIGTVTLSTSIIHCQIVSVSSHLPPTPPPPKNAENITADNVEPKEGDMWN